MSTEPSSRNDFIDFLKGVLIFLVVYGHVIQHLGYTRKIPWEESGFWSDPVFKLIYIFHMPLFMAVTGYLSYRATQNRTLGEVIWRRFQQLIIPAICWVTLDCCFSFFIERTLTLGSGAHVFSPLASSKDIIYRICSALAHVFSPLASSKDILYRICSSFWFLWAAFGSVVIVSCLRRVKLDRIGVFAIATIVALLLPNWGNILLFKYAFPYYCIGYAIAKKDPIRITSLNLTSVVVVLGFGVACYMCWDTNTYIYISGMGRHAKYIPVIAFRYFAGGILSVVFSGAMYYLYTLWKSSAIARFGRQSLGIYIIQSYVIACAAGLNHARIFHDLPYFTYTLAPAISLCICFFCVSVGGRLDRCPYIGRLFMGRVDPYPKSSSPLPLPVSQPQPSP
jgi:fucose 4-O-acetylase-like acetyltransferase